MALATLLLQPESLRPSVIILDEPELGLHPYAIALLVALIKAGRRQEPGHSGHTVADLIGLFRPRKRARDRPAGRADDVQAARCGRSESMAGGLQPGTAMGEERAWWPPHRSVDGAVA